MAMSTGKAPVARCAAGKRKCSINRANSSGPVEDSGERGLASLTSIGWADAVGIQDIAQGQDAFQLVDISAAHYRQDFDLVCTHALEGQIKPLVGVDVRKSTRSQQLPHLVGGIFCHLSFERLEGDNANYTSSISHQPGSEFTRAYPFQSLPNRDVGR